METRLTLALMALITGTAFGSMPAVLPEFKNAKQLAEWPAEMADKANAASSASDVRSSALDVPSAFYTGKPYVESFGGYAFKYRSYNPGLARWTSEDPSGFPDGANQNLYAPTPTRELDAQGLDTVTVTGIPGSSGSNGQNFSITVRQEAQQVGNSIGGQSVVDWVVDASLSGWVVQKVEWDFSGIYNDSDNSQYSVPNPPTALYWEAWRVNLGAVSGGDMFKTGAFPTSTHGIATITGKVDFYQDSVFTSTNSPGTWSTSAVPEAGGLNATTTEPTWWTGSGFNHKLTVSWE